MIEVDDDIKLFAIARRINDIQDQINVLEASIVSLRVEKAALFELHREVRCAGKETSA